jgi:hypothetical protein
LNWVVESVRLGWAMLDLPVKISANMLNNTRQTALQLPFLFFLFLVDEAFWRILFEYFCELASKKKDNIVEYFRVTIGDLWETPNIEISVQFYQ